MTRRSNLNAKAVNNFEVVLKKAKGRRAGGMTDDEREEMEDNEE